MSELGKLKFLGSSKNLIAGDSYVLKFKYIAGSKGISPGGGIKFRMPLWWGWSPPQITNKGEEGYIRVSFSIDQLRHKVKVENYSIYVLLEDGLPANGEIFLTYNGRVGPTTEEAIAFRCWVDLKGSGYFLPIATPTLNLVHGNPALLFVVGPSLVGKNEKFEFSVSILDKNLNPVDDYQGSISFLPLEEATLPTGYQFKPMDKGSHRFMTKFREEGIYRIKIKDKENNLEGASNPIRVLPKAPSYKLFWGDIHGHANLSDGVGSVDNYYQYGRDYAHLDIIALTEHDNCIHRRQFFELQQPEWDYLRERASFYNKEGKFITLLAYEWTASWLPWTKGHLCVYYKKDGPLLRCTNYNMIYLHETGPENGSPERLVKLLEGKEAIAFPHHVYDPKIIHEAYANPAVQPLIQVYSIHGDSDYKHNRSKMVEKTVESLLERGVKVGIIGSSDSHNGHPGLVAKPGFNPPNAHGESHYGSLMGVYAPSLTKEDIWEALKSRHTYATTGERIILDFKLNNSIMGDEVIIGNPRERRHIEVKVIGTNKIQWVKIYRNNEVITLRKNLTEKVSISFTDKEPVYRELFYFVQIKQVDGNRCWSSPIWVRMEEKN